MEYLTVTELAGDEVSQDQVERIYQRYIWASRFCDGKDVLEVACGTGQGLGLLASHCRSLVAGDISDEMLEIARSHYGAQIDLRKLDAQALPLNDNSLDIVILFEAIYYLPDPDQFVGQCRRVLRDGGKVLIATANKDLPDFNPSPYSHRYYGVPELRELFSGHGFSTEFVGDTPISRGSLRPRVFRLLKRIAVATGMMPKTMKGKKMLKRIVFGKLVKMPEELREGTLPYQEPTPILPTQPDTQHKVIYCAATENAGCE